MDQRVEYQNLRIVCSIFNSQRTSKSQKVFKPEDFMEFPGKEKKQEPNASASLFAQMDAFAMAVYGINNQGEQEARERIARELAASEAASNGAASPME